LGVPVIANLTGDIGQYVREGEEGVVLEGITPEAFAAGVRRALVMPEAHRAAMRVNARQRAADCFDYHHFAAPLRDFVEEAVASAGDRRSTPPRT
jgi:glycosyltransferase involved in cell wall biosynthesis